jgi:hypothetical protein
VDDIIMGGTAYMEETKTKLLGTFDGRDLGETSFFLGMTISRNPAVGTIHLCQQQYTKELITKYGMSNSNPRSTPWPQAPSWQSAKASPSTPPSTTTAAWLVP